MFWKPANYQKKFGELYSPCQHNTCGIPDALVMASGSDIPNVTISYEFSSLEEKTKAEVLAVIECMNLRGKFVSKKWVCDTLHFKMRKADDIFTELKREGKIVELYAVRYRHKHGSFYRIAGNKAKRAVQRAHALIRRNRRALHKGELNSPKGSLKHKETFPENSLPTGDVAEKATTSSGFEKPINPAKSDKPRRHFEDGHAGNGLDNTCYSEAGCFARLTDWENNTAEYDLIERLVEVSSDHLLTPVCARSAARRIDSGVISDESVDKICEILKNKKLHYYLLDLIRGFSNILREHTEIIHKDELDSLEESIINITEGPGEDVAGRELRTVFKALKSYMCLPDGHEQFEFYGVLGAMQQDTLPLHYKLLLLAHSGKITDKVLYDVVNDIKDALYKQLSNDFYAYNLLKYKFKIKYIDWTEFESFRQQYIGGIKCTLHINKLSSPALNNFYVQLTRMNNNMLPEVAASSNA